MGVIIGTAVGTTITVQLISLETALENPMRLLQLLNLGWAIEKYFSLWHFTLMKVFPQ
jgi:Na+/phosphate symporter